MQHDALGDDQAPLGPRSGQREVVLRRLRAGQPMQRERRLVREHAGLPRPQPQRGEVLVRGEGEVDEPVDPAPQPPQPTDHGVVREQLGRVANPGRLLRGEVPGLRGRQLKETVPVRRGWRRRRHAAKLSGI